MNQKDRIEKEVEETIAYLERPEEIGESPFFFTRLGAKIRELEEIGGSAFLRNIFAFPVLRPLLLSLLVAVNLLTAVIVYRESAAASREAALQVIADEYSLTVNGYNYFS